MGQKKEARRGKGKREDADCKGEEEEEEEEGEESEVLSLLFSVSVSLLLQITAPQGPLDLACFVCCESLLIIVQVTLKPWQM